MSTPLFHSAHSVLSRSTQRCPSKKRGNIARSGHPATTCVDREVPCYVYLLVHATQARFKIGVAANTRQRAAQLPEADSINFSESFQAWFPNRARAYQVEKMLHCGLAAFHQPVKVPQGNSSNGATEWFASEALVHAVNLLRIAPKGRENTTHAPLLSLASLAEETQEDAIIEVNDQCKRKLPLAAKTNVEAMSRIVQLISEISYRLSVTWHRPSGQRERLCVHDIRDQWELGLLKSKQKLMSAESWWMQTKDGMHLGDRVPLVTLIRYQEDKPTTLELEIQDMAMIRKLPGGFQLMKMWRALCGRYE